MSTVLKGMNTLVRPLSSAYLCDPDHDIMAKVTLNDEELRDERDEQLEGASNLKWDVAVKGCG